ncbi:MAG: 4-hydroxybenzoate octaprenyltransferase [Phenylobacterium sp.]|uniref:4-hydroxybenzoate octaprenyltransferase n=1 Tax=Phenylobacterium sp. TaxID=1871053 RepID=UPI001A513FD7|nr:4-hydroxybenzoate octaprenyltransferase [Phenylobacterium sp.]MBL8772480.1 4-hydroxybenzoate octaprenyltransferase [Phenylobacterium sp.]
MKPSAPLPDAAPTNWVDRWAPARLRPWLKLGRFDRPVGVWLLMLPGWQGITLAAAEDGRLPDPMLLALFFVGAALMRAAGCAYNDIVDRDIDAKVARTAGRPVASGQIRVKQAWAFLIACSLVSLVILLALSPLAVALGVASLALVAAYPFMKRITWWPQAWLGLTFNWGALLGYAAATGGSVLGGAWTWQTQGFVLLDYGHLSAAAILLYASGVFWTLGYDTIYAIQDLEDDALAGVKSSARRLGRAAPKAVMGFYFLAVTAAFVAGQAAGLGAGFHLALFAFAIHLALQARRVRLDNPALALRLFKSNTSAGLMLVVALAAGALS